MVQNSSLIFAKIPEDYPVPGETLKKTTTELNLDAPLPPNSVLAKTICLSLDPYLRGRMRPAHIKSYAPAFTLGEPLTNYGVSEVLKSENPKFPVGAKVYSAYHKFSEYQIFPEDKVKELTVLENKEKLPLTTWVGACGMPGQTAWYGLSTIAKPQQGEAIFVSGAAGAVGQMVVCLAKRAGVKVIGSAGSDAKVAYLRDELKVDVAFNYKKESTREVLAANPFEMYWDNVGGATLEAVFDTIKEFGRIVACGAISEYNTKNPYGVKNTFNVFAKSLLFQGFIVLNVNTEGFYESVPKWIASGEIHPPKEHIYKGLDNGEAFLDLMTGGNFGKAVISFE